MTQRNELQNHSIHSAPVGVRMMQGGGLALILILIFLLSAGEPDPDWPQYWIVKPLLVVPVAGAIGGVFYFFMDHLRAKSGWLKALGALLSIAGYFVVLWLGTVEGLNGTMWD